MEICEDCLIEFDQDDPIIRCHSCGSLVLSTDKTEILKWNAKTAERKDLIGHSKVIRFFCQNCGKRKG